jgi:hypothetical protein
MLRDTWHNDAAVARAARGAALGALAGSLFNRPGTGAVVGGLLGLAGGAVREATPADVKGSCVILFYAPWCPACTRFRTNESPLVPAELAKRGRHDLPVLQIDIAHRPGLDITGKIIRSIPTVVFIDSAKRPHVFEGVMRAGAIADFATSSEAIVLHGGFSEAEVAAARAAARERDAKRKSSSPRNRASGASPARKRKSPSRRMSPARKLSARLRSPSDATRRRRRRASPSMGK